MKTLAENFNADSARLQKPESRFAAVRMLQYMTGVSSRITDKCYAAADRMCADFPALVQNAATDAEKRALSTRMAQAIAAVGLPGKPSLRAGPMMLDMTKTLMSSAKTAASLEGVADIFQEAHQQRVTLLSDIRARLNGAKSKISDEEYIEVIKGANDIFCQCLHLIASAGKITGLQLDMLAAEKASAENREKEEQIAELKIKKKMLEEASIVATQSAVTLLTPVRPKSRESRRHA